MRLLSAAALSAALLSPSSAAVAQCRERETVFSREFAVRAGAALAVDVTDANVEIEVGATDRAIVTIDLAAHDLTWARDRYDRMRFAVTEQEGGLMVRSQHVRPTRSNWHRDRCMNVTVRVALPAQFDLDLRTGDGDVVVGDLTGTIDIKTSDGDIRLGAVTGPQIRIETSDGDIDAMALTSPETSIYTGDGDVRLDAVRGMLAVETGDGDVAVGLMESQGANLSTGDGDVYVTVPMTLAANVELRGEDLVFEQELRLVGPIRDDLIRGQLNGGGPPLRVRTGDGRITVRPHR